MSFPETLSSGPAAIPHDDRPGAGARRGRRLNVIGLASRYGLVVLFIALVLFFSLLMPDTFATQRNFAAIAGSQAITFLLALAVITPLAVGEFDLSVAANFAYVHMITAGMLIINGWSLPVVVVVSMATGIAVGAVNALLVVRFGVSSFVATLGTQTILIGLLLQYSDGGVITGEMPAGFLELGQGKILGVPTPFWCALVVAFFLWILLAQTSTGRRIVATGGNRAAASLMGIHVNRIVVLAFVLCGAIAAFAGILMTARTGSGQPTVGASYLLPAYAGAFLGSTTISPGRFNVVGTFVAVYFLATLVTGLQQLGVQSWIQYVVNGLALVIAVIVSGWFAAQRSRWETTAAKRSRTTPAGTSTA